MKLNKSHKSLCISLLYILLYSNTWAQDISSDDYFQLARKAAFVKEDYRTAIQLLNKALGQSPGYTDIRIFLGRVYYWNKQADSSLMMLKMAIQEKPAYEDAAVAIADISYYQENYTAALAYINSGLSYNPSSKELMIRKAKCLAATELYNDAYDITDSLLHIEPSNDLLRSLAERIKDFRSKNKVGISYEYTGFDKQFSNPWHIVSIDYTRQTKAGSFTGRINYANRHTKNGLQFEMDAYPRISKTFYAYTNIGFSPDMPVFPKLRAGFSLYANLPKSMEADAGFRYLNFDSDTWIYTLSLGKYYKNFWFNARTYLTPSSNRISQSYTVTTRYYLKGADNYVSFFVGRGISPDDRSQNIQLNNAYKLQSKRIGGGYRFAAGKLNLFSLSCSFENVEYLPKTKGNQFDISVGYQRRF